MSKYFELNGYIFKISNKVLNNFEVYSYEQQTQAHITLCKYLYEFVVNLQLKNTFKIEQSSITYYNNIIDFSKYDKTFRQKLINRVIIYINKLEYKNNTEGLFKKLCDFIEE